MIHERDRRTDGQTDRHCMTAKTALASHRAVKSTGHFFYKMGPLLDLALWAKKILKVQTKRFLVQFKNAYTVVN